MGGCSPRAQIARGDGGCPPAPRRKPTLLPCGAAPADSGRESGAAAVAPAPGYACQAPGTREAGRSQPRGYASLLHSGRSQPGDLAWIQASFPASPSGPAPRGSPSRQGAPASYPHFGPAAAGGIGYAERSPRRPCRRGAASPRSGRRLRRTLRGMVAGGTRRPPISVSMIRHKNRPAVWFPPLPLPPRPPLPATPFQRGRVHTGGEGRGKSPYWREYAPAIFWGETKRLGPEYGRRAVFLCQDHGDLVRRFAP